MGGQTRPRNYQYLGSPPKRLLSKGLGAGPIPGMTPTQALTSIQTMADHSQKWHNGTTSKNIGSSSSNDGLTALVNKLDNLGRDMKKLKESVHAIQVRCQICEGPHLDKDCHLNKEVKQVEEVKDSVWSERYSEWCNENSHDEKPRPRDYTFKESVIDQFTKALDPNKDPLERCLDEYNRTKCKRGRCKNKDWWYDYWYEDEEKMELGSEDYNPPMVHTESFEVTKYKFNNGCSFICVSGENNETLSLERKNGSRFRKMIMEEMEEVLKNDGEDSDDDT
ncbi:hypothetical protein Tco_0396129 [Tanacetum coccineum]